MRKKNSINNISYSLLFFSINSLLTFLSKSAMIFYIGSEYTGLSTVCRSIIGMLSIAELGVSNAVTYSLYKPLREEDYSKINSIINTYKWVYRIIGSILLLLSIVISAFIENFIHSENINIFDIRIYFIIFSIITVSSYFITYPQVLAIADQKNYLVTKIEGIINIIKIIVQVLTLIIFKDYKLWICIEVILTIYTYIYTNRKIKSIYPWLDISKKIELKESLKQNKNIIKDTKDIFVHKLAYTIGYQTDSILISSFTNLSMITIYTNYMMIINLLRSLVSMIINGIRSSVGDLIAEGNDVKSYTMWIKLSTSINIIGTILVYCVYMNIHDLIIVWLNKDYLINNFVVVVMCIILFIQITMFDIIELFKNGYGIFNDKWAPIAEGLINLAISLILVKYIGVIGVLIGTLISMLAIAVWWKPYLVFKYGFKISILKYIKHTFKNIIIATVSMFISAFIINSIINVTQVNIITFILKSLLSLITIIISYLIISLFDNSHRDLYIYILNLIKTKNVQNY